MKNILLGLFIVISFLFLPAFADEEPLIMEQLTPNGEIMVQLLWPTVLPDELYKIEVRFLDPQTNELIVEDEWVNYSVLVMQQDHIIEKYPLQGAKGSIDTFEVVFPEEGTGSAEVTIIVTQITEKSTLIPVEEGQKVSFSVQVVPEFSTMAVVMLSTAFALLFIFSKFRTIPSFKIQIKN